MASQIDNVWAILSSIISWRTMALLLAITNLKNLPFVWHLRILRHCLFNIRWRTDYPFFPKGVALQNSAGKPTHPVFVPYGITSRTPLMETDYNLHKSNSTYFTDLDIARTALVTRIYSPGVGLISKELDVEYAEAARKEGKKPPARKSILIVLGSVYCNFKREIKPYELYEIETKVLGWDRKWMYVFSAFLRPVSKKGEKRTIFATSVSKYVVKKGRLTIAPERVLRRSGFLPPRPEGDLQPLSEDGSGTGTPSGITSAASGVDGSLVREVLNLQDKDIPEKAILEAEKKLNTDSWDENEWTWERIEEERLRGIELLEGFINLDVKLLEEWER